MNQLHQLLSCLKLLIEGSTIETLEGHFGHEIVEVACDMFMEIPDRFLPVEIIQLEA